MNAIASAAVLVCLCFCSVAVADEVRLKDGRVLVGTVVQQGNVYIITTRDGVVRVNVDEVEVHGWRKTDQLLREFTAMEQSAEDKPFQHLQLAMQARNWGLEEQLWKNLDRVVDLRGKEGRTTLCRHLADFLAQLEPEILPRKYRSAETRVRVYELLARVPSQGAAGRRAAVEELLVREPNADKDLKAEARANQQPARRECALAALVRRETKGNDAFLWRTSILDPDKDVRSASMHLARDYTNTQDAVRYLTPGLMHANAEVRVRTGEAFGNLGELAAVKPLVLAGPNAAKALADSSPGVRAYAAFVNQQAYIRDFDVEVAQAAAIAKPRVSVLQSGAVLDVTVQATLEERIRIVNAWRGALRRLAGSDPGPRTSDWATWLAAVQDKLQPQGEVATPSTPDATPKKG
jgi:hypothetical protein